jgi:hypothetical protein
MCRSRTLSTAAAAGGGGMCLRGSSMTLPASLEQWPPTVTAAVWKALEVRAALAARRTSVPSEETTRVSSLCIGFGFGFE